MTRLSVLLILISLCFSPQLSALQLGTYSSPPFSMFEDGELLGLASEVVTDLLAEANLSKDQVLQYPLARAEVELAAGRIDILYPYLNAKTRLQQNFRLIGPIARYNLAIFTTDDNPAPINLDSIAKQTVAVERGSIAEHTLVDKDISIKSTSDELSCLTMVLAKRLPYCVTGVLAGMYTAALNNIYMQFNYYPSGLYSNIYIALSPEINQQAATALEQAYQQLKSRDYFSKKQKDYENKFKIFIDSLASL